jgi:head-tail adaptor
MRAGRLRNTVSVEQQSETYLATGEPAQTWTTFITSVRCEIRGTGGGERRRGAQTENNPATTLLFRYEDGKNITSDMRVKSDGRTLNIQRIEDPDGRGERVLATCGEVS